MDALHVRLTSPDVRPILWGPWLSRGPFEADGLGAFGLVSVYGWWLGQNLLQVPSGEDRSPSVLSKSLS